MKKKLSIVAPVYNEEGGIALFNEKLSTVLQGTKYDYEIIYVNDGSRDNSLPLLVKMAQEDKRIKVVNLSRNFGHQAAVSAGLTYTTGEFTIITDTDLQDPPEVMLEMIAKWEEGFEIVHARRRSRQDTAFKKFTASAFYKLLNMLIKNKIPENVGDFRLMDKKTVKVLNSLPEKDRYLRGLASWIGFKQTFVDFDRDKRFAGVTNYPLSKMIKLALDAIYSFSDIPMKLATYAGIAFIALSIIIIIYTIIVRLLHIEVPGWTSQVLIMIIFNGIQLLILGIMSEYIGRIYKQIQGRPIYVVSEVIETESK
jgi:dolichol-phosphate mannosyltransferase